MLRRKWTRRGLRTLLVIFLLMNVVAAFHAWKFTHTDPSSKKAHTKDPNKLSFGEKLRTLFTGVSNSKPMNMDKPTHPYETIMLQSNKKIECWHIKQPATSKGTIVLFHGYLACKGMMLDKAEVFYSLGYNILLVDQVGCGGSEGVQTTIGYKEAENVKTCYNYLASSREQNIILFGTSMGAAAIMKAMHDTAIKPAGIIIECPFGTMYKTVCARFRSMHVPSFPLASMLVFWGGLENGFWAFGHNPEAYASSITCPTLLMWGEQDERVSRKETEAIYANLPGPKTLVTFPLAGHENYLKKYGREWMQAVTTFTTHLEQK